MRDSEDGCEHALNEAGDALIALPLAVPVVRNPRDLLITQGHRSALSDRALRLQAHRGTAASTMASR